jgi:hypothetical protein
MNPFGLLARRFCHGRLVASGPVRLEDDAVYVGDTRFGSALGDVISRREPISQSYQSSDGIFYRVLKEPDGSVEIRGYDPFMI